MSDPVFAISRTLDAPLSLVWETYTQEKHLSKWWGPKGFPWVSGKLDFRPGGYFHYCMLTPDGKGEMWGRFDYREIEKMKRIVFTTGFSDKDGNIVRAPFAATFPLRILNDVRFSEKDGKTALDMTGTPFEAGEDEKAFFKSMYPSMTQGFNGTFDKFDEYLASLK